MHGQSDSQTLRALLDDGLQSMSIELDAVQCDKLIQLLALIAKWNRVYNLTAVRTTREMVGRHVLDSLSLMPFLQTLPKQTIRQEPGVVVELSPPDYDVLDVGSGAGLPVLPLAIARPDLHFLSVESNGKKTRFQQQAIVELGLSNVDINQSRIEEVGSTATTVVSRAFTAPVDFLKVVTRNCVDQSCVLVMLGQKEQMKKSLPTGFSLERVHELNLPQSESQRHIGVCHYSANALT